MDEVNVIDGFTIHNDELAACALINLENIARMMPELGGHPMYAIARAQLKALSDRLNA